MTWDGESDTLKEIPPLTISLEDDLMVKEVMLPDLPEIDWILREASYVEDGLDEHFEEVLEEVKKKCNNKERGQRKVLCIRNSILKGNPT